MRKIPSVFLGGHKPNEPRTKAINPSCDWVLDPAVEVKLTEKVDGLCCMVHGDKLWRRLRVHPLDFCPPTWIHWSGSPLAHGVGWIPISEAPVDKYHREGWNNAPQRPEGGTYELIGPHVNGNPYNCAGHHLIKHGEPATPHGHLVPRFGRHTEPEPQSAEAGVRFYANLTALLEPLIEIEGIVWHEQGGKGRMAKVKRIDLGLVWPASKE